jgi:hypothetical protein
MSLDGRTPTDEPSSMPVVARRSLLAPEETFANLISPPQICPPEFCHPENRATCRNKPQSFVV